MTDQDLALDQPETAAGAEGDIQDQESSLSKEEQFKAKLKEAISVERRELGALRLNLTVTVPREMLDDRLQEEFKELKKEALVPGFRKGHAPLKLVEKRFGTDVGDQLKTQLVSNGYMLAVEKEGLKPLGDPLFFVKVKEDRTGYERQVRTADVSKLLPLDKALEWIELPKEGSLQFSCEVELKPQFELPKLEGIEVNRPKVGITDNDVESEVKRLCMTRATFQPIEGGPVEANDLLYADLTLTVEGQTVATESNVELSARTVRCKGIILKDFGTAVIGKSVSDTVTLDIAVPEDHDDLSLRGKTANFSFILREIKRLIVPPLDERLLALTGCESEADLRSLLRSNLEARLEDTLRKAMQNQIAEYLVRETNMEIPAGLSQRQTDRAVQRRMMEMLDADVPQAEMNKTADELRGKAQEQVIHDLKLYFILEKVAEDRKIDVSEDELNGAIASIARRNNQRFDKVRDELHASDKLVSLYMFMRDQKVLDTLLDEAKINEVEGPDSTPATPS